MIHRLFRALTRILAPRTPAKRRMFVAGRRGPVQVSRVDVWSIRHRVAGGSYAYHTTQHDSGRPARAPSAQSEGR